MIGGPYNSGILATGAKPGANYDYDSAPTEILERVRRIEEICAAHETRMVDAAFQFPLLYPSVVSVIPGGQQLGEMTSNLASAQTQVPPALWGDLKSAGLMRDDAPTTANR